MIGIGLIKVDVCLIALLKQCLHVIAKLKEGKFGYFGKVVEGVQMAIIEWKVFKIMALLNYFGEFWCKLLDMDLIEAEFVDFVGFSMFSNSVL